MVASQRRRELWCSRTDFESWSTQSARQFGSTPFFPRRDSIPSPSEPAADRLKKSAAEQRSEFVVQLRKVADRFGELRAEVFFELLFRREQVVADVRLLHAELPGQRGVGDRIRRFLEMVFFERQELDLALGLDEMALRPFDGTLEQFRLPGLVEDL